MREKGKIYLVEKIENKQGRRTVHSGVNVANVRCTVSIPSRKL